MRNHLIPIAIGMIQSGQITVTEAAALCNTTHGNISQYCSRRGITPRVRVDARHAQVQALWQQNLTQLLGHTATTTLDAVNRFSITM